METPGHFLFRIVIQDKWMLQKYVLEFLKKIMWSKPFLTAKSQHAGITNTETLVYRAIKRRILRIDMLFVFELWCSSDGPGWKCISASQKSWDTIPGGSSPSQMVHSAVMVLFRLYHTLSCSTFLLVLPYQYCSKLHFYSQWLCRLRIQNFLTNRLPWLLQPHNRQVSGTPEHCHYVSVLRKVPVAEKKEAINTGQKVNIMKTKEASRSRR